MLVGQCDQQLVIHVVTVHVKPAEELSDVEGLRLDDLAAGDGHAVEPTIPVQEEQLAAVQLDVHDAELEVSQKCAVEECHQVEVELAIHQEQLDVGVVAVLRIHSVSQVRPHQVVVAGLCVVVAQ